MYNCCVLKLAPRSIMAAAQHPARRRLATHRFFLLFHARGHLRHCPVDCIEFSNVWYILLHIHGDGLGGIELPRPKLAHVGSTNISSPAPQHYTALCTSRGAERAAAHRKMWGAPPRMCPFCRFILFNTHKEMLGGKTLHQATGNHSTIMAAWTHARRAAPPAAPGSHQN